MPSTTIPTPAGPLVVVVDDDGAVLAAGWSDDVDEVVARIHPRLRPAAVLERADVGDAGKAVAAYLEGDLSAPAGVAVRQVGGPFLERAWVELAEVPAGATVTYTELARRAGNPAAARAAASACARNAPALFVPCHRVVRNDGTLGGFRWGVDVKRWLLAYEGVQG